MKFFGFLIIALPFVQLAIDIYTLFFSESSGTEYNYYQININPTLNAIEVDRNGSNGSNNNERSYEDRKFLMNLSNRVYMVIAGIVLVYNTYQLMDSYDLKITIIGGLQNILLLLSESLAKTTITLTIVNILFVILIFQRGWIKEISIKRNLIALKKYIFFGLYFAFTIFIIKTTKDPLRELINPSSNGSFINSVLETLRAFSYLLIFIVPISWQYKINEVVFQLDVRYTMKSKFYNFLEMLFLFFVPILLFSLNIFLG